VNPSTERTVLPADLSERTLREVFFPPFEAGVKAGAMSLMTAHNELNGIPCHSNEWLMQDTFAWRMELPRIRSQRLDGH